MSPFQKRERDCLPQAEREGHITGQPTYSRTHQATLRTGSKGALWCLVVPRGKGQSPRLLMPPGCALDPIQGAPPL